MGLLEEMRGLLLGPDLVAFSAAISSCGGGQWELAALWLDELRRSSRALEKGGFGTKEGARAGGGCGLSLDWGLEGAPRASARIELI